MTEHVHTVGYFDDGICASLVYEGDKSEAWIDEPYGGVWFTYCPECGEKLDRD